MTAKDFVANGAALLDEKAPGWENQIDVDKLHVGSLKDCVLGQLAGSYKDGRKLVNLGTGIHHGFTLPPFNFQNIGWDDLNMAWVDEIVSRQYAAERAEDTRGVHYAHREKMALA